MSLGFHWSDRTFGLLTFLSLVVLVGSCSQPGTRIVPVLAAKNHFLIGVTHNEPSFSQKFETVCYYSAGTCNVEMSRQHSGECVFFLLFLFVHYMHCNNVSNGEGEELGGPLMYGHDKICQNMVQSISDIWVRDDEKSKSASECPMIIPRKSEKKTQTFNQHQCRNPKSSEMRRDYTKAWTKR